MIRKINSYASLRNNEETQKPGIFLILHYTLRKHYHKLHSKQQTQLPQKEDDII